MLDISPEKYQATMFWYWCCIESESDKKRQHALYKLRCRLFEEYHGFPNNFMLDISPEKYQATMFWYWCCIESESDKKRQHALYKLRCRLFEEYHGFPNNFIKEY